MTTSPMTPEPTSSRPFATQQKVTHRGVPLLSGLASPFAAAAFAAGLVYVWGEAAFRLAFTYSPAFDARWVLWNGRVGDIAAMWLTISVLAAVTFLALRFVWRGRSHVGPIMLWTIVLILSAIAAPLIGEIGTPITG